MQSDSGVLRLIHADPIGYVVLSGPEIASSETWFHVARAEPEHTSGESA